jgi:hypothetical protein
MSAPQTADRPTIRPGPFGISPTKVLQLEKLALEHRSRLDRLEKDIVAAGPGPVPYPLAKKRALYLEDFKERAKALSPIQRYLSQDLLLCVFEACYSQMSEQDFKGTMPNVWPPNIFTQVCQQWREVSAGRSRFWDHISLPLAKLETGDITDNELHRKLSSLAVATRMWVKNSKQLELKLYLEDTTFVLNERAQELLREIWKPLLDASPRWHTIQGSLQYKSPLYKFLLGSEWGKEDIQDLTIRKISLAFEFSGRYPVPIESTSLIRAQSLHYLDISDRFIVNHLSEFLPSWTSLTTLRGIWATPFEVYHILKVLQQLKNGGFVCPRFERPGNQTPGPEERRFDEAKALKNAQPIESQLEEVEFVNFPPKLLNQLCSPIKFSRLSSLTLKNSRCRHSPFREQDCDTELYSIITDYGPKGLTYLHLEHVCISVQARQLADYLRSLVDVTHLTLSYSSRFSTSGSYDYVTPVFDDGFLEDIIPKASSSDYRPRLPNLQSLRCDFLNNEHASTCFIVQRIKELIRARRHPQSSLCGVADLQELFFRCRVLAEVDKEIGEEQEEDSAQGPNKERQEDVIHEDLAGSLAKEGLDVEGLKAQGEFRTVYDPDPSSSWLGPTRSELQSHSDWEVPPGGSIAANLPDEEFFEVSRAPSPASPHGNSLDLPDSSAPNSPVEEFFQVARAPSTPSESNDLPEDGGTDD